MESLDFGDAPRLKAQLFTTCMKAGIKNAAIAVFRSGRAVSAAYPDTFDSTGIAIGCLWKGLTATVIGTLIAEGKFRLEDAVGELVRSTLLPDTFALNGIEVRHLLTHTHGFDDSNLRTAPFLTNGCIDIAQLVARLSSQTRIGAPGAAFHYGNAGSWLAAAILENRLQRPFGEVLIERLFPQRFHGARVEQGAAQRICPSLGGDDVLFSARELLTLVAQRYLLPGEPNIAFMQSETVALPGYTPGKNGATCGWYDYGSGWYGQNGIYNGQSAILRFNPQRQFGIAVTSESEQAFRVLSIGFANILPEFQKRREFRSVDFESRLNPQEISRYFGAFENAGIRLTISPGDDGDLKVTVEELDNPLEDLPRNRSYVLRPTKDRIFYCVPGDRNFTHLEFISAPATADFPYIWNGRQLWRRTTEPRSIR